MAAYLDEMNLRALWGLATCNMAGKLSKRNSVLCTCKSDTLTKIKAVESFWPQFGDKVQMGQYLASANLSLIELHTPWSNIKS